jgi:ATP/maltotriose-dependent transcriptional regulator MalT
MWVDEGLHRRLTLLCVPAGTGKTTLLSVACIGTAVVQIPIVKRQNEAVALDFVDVRARLHHR